MHIHENAEILQLHTFNFDASWSIECRLTQREIFTSFLLDVATLQRTDVATLLRIFINESKIKIEQHLFAQKSRNTIIAGGVIARVWIEDPMVYPGTQMPKRYRWVPDGTAMATDMPFVKIVWCLLIILATIC